MPYNAVKTKDGHIVIDAHLPKFWSSFCLALKVKELETDPRFHNLEARNNHRQELLNLLNSIFSMKTSQEWLEILEANGIPCTPINDLKAALNDPATRALNMVVDIEHKGVGLTFKTAGNPIRMPNSAEQPHSSPPLLGEHTEAIVKELLGYSDGKIKNLLQQKALGLPPSRNQTS